MENSTDMYTWAGYFIFVFLSSALGDSTILLATIRHNAIKLHKLIVVIIQHIAVCDLLVSTCTVSVLPRAVSLITGGWVFGRFLCNVMTYTAYWFVPVGILLICCMTTCKLLILMYPLRIQSVTTKQAHSVCAAVWLVVLIVPAALLLNGYDDVTFKHTTYVCDYGFTVSMWGWLRPTLVTIFIFVPNFFVLASTVLLLVLARKVARRGNHGLKWQGVMTTVLVATVFCISGLPYFIYSSAQSSVSDQTGFFHNEFYRIAESCLYLNTISNFYIYCFTVSSFRVFVRSRLLKCVPCCTRGGGQIKTDEVQPNRRDLSSTTM